ncbi:MAG: peptidylprolyl isomerase [Patescibacteria group bacterium]
MQKKLFMSLIFGFLILNFSACTLTDPEHKKDISTNNAEINISNPEQINIKKQENQNLLNKNINRKENMREDKNIAATQAVISTSKGNIVIRLESDAAPKTVENFANKAMQGFYKGLTFHRVEDWVIQGGDPDGNGTGGGKMPTEINDLPFTAGSVGVARGGDIAWSNDSQFFICTTDCNWLTKQYTNFGQVIEGMDIVGQIAIGDSINSISTK